MAEGHEEHIPALAAEIRWLFLKDSCSQAAMTCLDWTGEKFGAHLMTASAKLPPASLRTCSNGDTPYIMKYLQIQKCNSQNVMPHGALLAHTLGTETTARPANAKA